VTLNVAHRGNPVEAPESTLPAFESAVALEVDMIEFDVHRLADGQLAVMHDDTVDRCTDGSGLLAEMTLAEVKALDAGSWFDQRFAGTRVPTLPEAIEAIPAPIEMNVHLKTVRDEDDRFEMSVLEQFHEAEVADRVLVVHHHLPSLERLRQEAPELEYCWLPRVADGLECSQQHPCLRRWPRSARRGPSTCAGPTGPGSRSRPRKPTAPSASVSPLSRCLMVGRW